MNKKILLLALIGLWTWPLLAQGAEVDSLAIIVNPANGQFRQVPVGGTLAVQPSTSSTASFTGGVLTWHCLEHG